MNEYVPASSNCRVCASIRACKRGIVAVAVFSLCENLLMLAAPLYMMQVYDRVLASRSLDTLLYLTLVLAFALAILGLLDLARARVLAAIGVWLEHRLSPELFERAIRSRLRGRTYGPEALGDLAVLRNFVTSPGMTAIFDLPWTVVFIGAAFMLHPWFGYLAVGSAALLFGLALLGELITRGPIRKLNETGMLSRRDMDATSRNAEVIEAMGMMSVVSSRWVRRGGEALDLQSRILARSTTLSSTTKFIRMLMQSLSLGIGAWLVIEQQATGGIMIAASILLARALAPIEQSIGGWRSIVTVRAALARLKAFAREPEFRPTGMILPTPMGNLSVEGLSHSVEPGKPPLLKDLSFAIAAGESLAVIGPSGAGKSTLVRLLSGALAPSRGIVRLDGADIFTWDREQVRGFLGYLPQDVELFAGTIAENIARMGPVHPEAVVAAAKLADVHDLILRLPKGYETDIGEGGQHLSGGQRQRIALARAVFGMPRLVVLDEPNSNLDGDGEIALVKAMAALKAAGSTVVVVTHRTALVQHVDKLLLMRDGRIEAFGPRQEVFARLVGRPQGTGEARSVVVSMQHGA